MASPSDTNKLEQRPQGAPGLVLEETSAQIHHSRGSIGNAQNQHSQSSSRHLPGLVDEVAQRWGFPSGLNSLLVLPSVRFFSPVGLSFGWVPEGAGPPTVR